MPLKTLLLAQSEPVAPVAPGQAPRALMDMLPILAIFVIFFFLMVRPRLKEEKKRKEMISQIKRGDEIVTLSGLYGKVVELSDSTVTVQIANGVNVKMDKQAIQGVAAQPAKTGSESK